MTPAEVGHEDDPDFAASEAHWIPLSDLMTGLMMVFMLIAVAFMVQVESEARHVRDIAVVYTQMRTELYIDLYREFEKDLPRWGAELDRDMTLRFKEPSVLFDTGKETLKPLFEEILNDFFPRYVGILTSPKYKSLIEEIRIEGHTSSIWNGNVSVDEAYFKNMELSQARTRATVEYILTQTNVDGAREWLKSRLTANGLSSSKPILGLDGREDQLRSQRVEFRVKTNADARIDEMLHTADS